MGLGFEIETKKCLETLFISGVLFLTGMLVWRVAFSTSEEAAGSLCVRMPEQTQLHSEESERHMQIINASDLGYIVISSCDMPSLLYFTISYGLINYTGFFIGIENKKKYSINTKNAIRQQILQIEKKVCHFIKKDAVMATKLGRVCTSNELNNKLENFGLCTISEKLGDCLKKNEGGVHSINEWAGKTRTNMMCKILVWAEMQKKLRVKKTKVPEWVIECIIAQMKWPTPDEADELSEGFIGRIMQKINSVDTWPISGVIRQSITVFQDVSDDVHPRAVLFSLCERAFIISPLAEVQDRFNLSNRVANINNVFIYDEKCALGIKVLSSEEQIEGIVLPEDEIIQNSTEETVREELVQHFIIPSSESHRSFSGYTKQEFTANLIL
ncbi:hypothetical protein NEIRO03_2600 [Nematocida sp. AWRm78]|nr:hypothetical protein NEIRO02_2592 [Nematocida sp. AWRm79]KAI5187793.1 hypothetical protein NEIRO03_2600 [Nematocida sp. AWRm78]